MILPRLRTCLWQPATLLLVWIVSLACSLLPGYVTPAAATEQPIDAVTPVARQITEAVEPTNMPADQAEATPVPDGY